jgi:tetratricopeptide (TPR) repeat protein
LLKGDHEGALAEIEQEPSEPWRLVGRALAYYAVGRKAAADAALNEMIQKYGQIMAVNIAYTYAWRGEVDHAFAWLEKAFQLHDPGVGAAGVDLLFVNLHSDPRWPPFLRKLGIAPEQLAAIKFDVKAPQ